MSNRGKATYKSRGGHIEYYRERSRAWLQHIPASTPAKSVTVRHVDELMQARSRAVAPSTVRKDLVALSTLFRWAIVRGYATANPASADRIARPSEPKRNGDYLTDDQERALLARCAPWLCRVIRWAIGTGMDRREILELRWRQWTSESGLSTHREERRAQTDRYL